ncbi:MAG: hypothetical protein AAGU11_04995 [Syntrophobacteraceae bacterium]
MVKRRKSDIFIFFIGTLLTISAAALVHSHLAREQAARLIELQSAMVRQLDLTDLCLFTEARYTRHPSQADRHTPFQDHPLALEHFPTGSLMLPPPALVRGN